MKILFYIVGVIFLIFLAIQIFAGMGQKDIETYPYKVIEKFDVFEIRNYESRLFTTVEVSNNGYEDSSNKGFSILAGYIFGGNERNEKIAMTSPVAMSLEDTMTMMFMVPKVLNRESLPKPNQSQIEFIEEPAKTVASIAFGGWANDEKIKKYQGILTSALDAEGIEYSNRYYFLGYNPPYEVFNRKNEIIVELAQDTINSIN